MVPQRGLQLLEICVEMSHNSQVEVLSSAYEDVERMGKKRSVRIQKVSAGNF